MERDEYTPCLFLFRGLPGSGKTTLAKMILDSANDMFAADDYFEKSGAYVFNPALLPEAHEECRNNVENAMLNKRKRIVVHNTFSMRWEAEPYFALAKKHGYNVFVLECQNDYGNVHNVPKESIQKMIERWEPIT